MIFFWAFIVGGTICAFGQFLMDRFKLLPVHVVCSFVAIGAALDVFGLYDRLIKLAGAGAQLPIMSFGHSIVHGAMDAAESQGLIGIASGMFELTTVGITSAILFAFISALIFNPKS
ncbi:MAG: stage V sporulation protein AE [Turicibacter sp.]|nr:stage V sporulation protein AE [Turicibacter sp.]